MASLKHQFMNATSACFEEGRDKHSDKRQNNFRSDHKIYSYSDLKNIRDLSSDFSKFLKENYNIKQVKDIKPEMAKAFLQSKISTCTQQTLNVYASRLNKLGDILNFKFKTANIDINVKAPMSEKGIRLETRGVSSVMKQSDYEKIINYAEEKNLKSKAVLAIQICREVGFRVEELAQLKVKNIDLENNKIIDFKNTKGGKLIHERSISEDLKHKIQQEIKDKESNEKILNVKSDSINKWLGRTQEKLGLGLEKNSVHDIRRMVAQEKYDQYRNSGMTKEQALSKVSVFLNHGASRDKLMTTSYVSNIW